MLLGSSDVIPRTGSPIWLRQVGRSVRPSLVWVGAFAAALLLGVGVAAGPLMLASVANAAFEDEFRSYRSPQALGLDLTLSGFTRPGPIAELLDHVRGLSTDELVAPPVVTISASEQSVATARGGDGTPAQMFVRDGAVEHLPGRSGAGEGWWIAESMAASLGVEPGDTLWLLTFGSSFPIRGTGHTAPVRVAGTYQDLHEVLDTSYWDPVAPLPDDSPIAEYWEPYVGRVVRQGPTNVEIRPRMVVAEPATLAAANWGDDLPLGQLHVSYPPNISGERLDAGRRSFAALSGLETSLMSPDTEVGRTLREIDPFVSPQDSFILLEDVIGYADRTSTLVGASTRPLITAVQIVAFLVVVSAGVYLVRLRGGELRLLRSQGLGPRVLSGYTTLEMVLPTLLGAVAGWGLAVVVVEWLGPGPVDSAPLLRATGLVVAAAALAGLLSMWLVTIVLMWAAEREAHPLHRVNRWRWEVPIVILAALAGYQAATRGTAIIAGPDGPEIDAFIVAFPLLALLAAAALVVRAGQIVLPRLRATGSPTPRARFLAAQRLASARVPALVYVGTSVAALGVLLYALIAQQSLDRTIDTKITTIVGADVAVSASADDIAPGPLRSTTVYRTGASFSDGSRVEVLAVDPATFGEIAGANGHSDGDAVAELLDGLGQDRGGRVGALLVNGSRSGVVALGPRVGGGWTIEVEILDRSAAFPGASSRTPTLVVAVDRYVDAVRAAQESSVDYMLLLERNQELWFDGDEEEIVAHLASFGVAAEEIRTAGELRRDPSVAAVAWTVDILLVIGLGGAVLALVGAVVYLYTRQDARLFSYLLLRKMGLSRRRHLAALVLEVGTVLGVGLVLGSAIGAATARFMALRLDPLPEAAGPPQFSVPYARIGLVALACLVGCAVAAWLVQRSSDRARPAELLRQGDRV